MDAQPISGGGQEIDLSSWIRTAGLEEAARWLERSPGLAALSGVLLVCLLAVAAFVVTRQLLLRLIANFARHSPTVWDDVLIEQKVFHRLAWAVPVLLTHLLIPAVAHLSAERTALLQRLSLCALVVVGTRVVGVLLASVDVLYSRYPMAKNRPIKGYLQVVLIVAWIFAAVIVIATLMNRSPWVVVSGLGAMTAVILLVFRDTLLSLVAGIQLTTHDLIRVDDWIEMPQFGADGDVVEIGLHAVKVQNWDRTITVIPTHRFLEHSFKNWRGMSESGGRRIKRAFNIDLSTIRFLEEPELERFSRFLLLRDYLRQKKEELEAYNREHCSDPSFIANARRLTNVGTLRAYVAAYLRQHPKVHQGMTFLIRHLPPTSEGLPIEIYVFSNDIVWANYEAIQADIFDHLLAMVPEFGLRLFQKPSGNDLLGLASRPREGSGVEPGRAEERNELASLRE